MSELRRLAEELVCALVDDPDKVSVTEVEGRQTCMLSVRVGNGDLGHVIGSRGKNITAVRTILQASGARDGFRVVVELYDPKQQSSNRKY